MHMHGTYAHAPHECTSLVMPLTMERLVAAVVGATDYLRRTSHASRKENTHSSKARLHHGVMVNCASLKKFAMESKIC
jgi:hypothetical protein